MLCRAMSCLTEPLMQAAERVLYCLGRHADVGLRYRQSPPTQSNHLVGFSDSDLAAVTPQRDTCSSTTAQQSPGPRRNKPQSLSPAARLR
eukprot:3344815-Pleurochrysis_carterae.AAC.2